MSSSNNAGGLAFPAEIRSSDQDISFGSPKVIFHPGMTLRDYFAAKAMQGICAHADTWGLAENGIAKSAYVMADAMLAARK